MSRLDDDRRNVQQDAQRSDEQFDELLAGDPADDDRNALHLDGEDADDLLLLREALDNYKTETLRFAEQQSITMPTPRAGRVAALWDGTPRWAMALTAVLALTAGSVLVAHRGARPDPVTIAAAPTAQALTDDNRLLLSVDQALSNNAAPSEEELGLTATSAHSMKHGRATN